MTERYQEHLTKAAAIEQSKAIDKALGLPRKGRNVGPGPHAPIPDVYTPGAVGWTASECSVIEDPVSKTACLILTDAAVALGKRSVVVDGKTVSVDLAKDVLLVKPAKYDPKAEADAKVVK